MPFKFIMAVFGVLDLDLDLGLDLFKPNSLKAYSDFFF
jgi:hypothetical protein